jgi:purine nucleosidase
MKYPAFLVSIFLLQLLGAQADPLLLKGNDRLAVCGDGTTNPGYAACLETYLLVCGPSVHVNDFSAPSPASADFLAHLETGVAAYKPTAALVLLGPASGDDDAGSAYRGRVTGLVEALKTDGVRTIVVGSPPCADPSKSSNNAADADARNKSLAALADVAKDIAAKEDVVYADVFGATTAAMTKARTLYGESYAFETDGPGSPSNLVVAYAFLKALGFSGNIGSVTVDLKSNRVILSPGQWLKMGLPSLSIQTFADPFSWLSSDKDAGDIRKCFPFDDELSRYILTVKNAPTAQTKITWGDENHDFSAADLAAGINLSREFAVSPFSDMIDMDLREVTATQARERASHEEVATHPDEAASAEAWDTVTQSAVASLASFTERSIRQTLNIQPLAQIEPWPKGPIPVIIDTDLDADVDDVGALAILNSLMDEGQVDLIGCVHDTTNVQLSSCAAIQAINVWYGHPHIPIGQSFGEKGPSAPMTSVLAPAPPEGYHKLPGLCNSSYTLQLHNRFEPTFPYDDKMPAGVDVYRKALAGAPDGSVVICSIGTMENVQDLVLSQPDSVSPLSGLDLVAKKVRCLVIMFNTQPQDGYLLSKWPTKIIWSTYIGSNVGTGGTLLSTPEDNPVRVAYSWFGVLHTGRQSWDLTAAWIAAYGPDDVFDLVPGRPKFLDEITKTPLDTPHPNDYEGTVKMPYPEVSKLLGAQLAKPPTK